MIGAVDPGFEGSVTAPDQVAVGERFIVTVVTFGSSTCTRADGADVTVSGNLVRFVPYDEVPIDEEVGCSRDSAPFEHTTPLRFEEPGLVTLRVLGQLLVDSEPVLDSIDIPIQVGPTP